MKNKFIKNVLWGFGGQLVIIVLGIIIPRIMLTSYGSDTNGLISTIGQIFTYMSLLEAGIGQATKIALYKPISENNKKEFSYVVSVAKRYYNRISIYYGIGVIFLAFLLPVIMKTSLNYWTVFFVVLFEGMSGVVSFLFLQTKSTILLADGKGYINNGVNVVNKTISYAVKIMMAYLKMNIVFLQFIYFILTILKIFFYTFYFNKKYSWLDYSMAPKTARLKDRNSFIITEIAWTIFSSTDMIVLSTFLSTQMASVYSIYNLVFVNINSLFSAVYNSVNYVLGQTYFEDKNRYIRVHDAFNSIFFGGMTILMCISYTLIIPFVKLYTNGVSDVEYINYSLPVLFCLVQIVSWSRYVSGNLSGIAGYAKLTSIISLIEALLNVSLSIILVHKFGIVGVLVATVLALPLKVIYLTVLSEKVILKRSCIKTIKIMIVNFLLFGITIAINKIIELNIANYGQFLLNALVISIIYCIIGVLVNYLANKDCIKILKKLKKQSR